MLRNAVCCNFGSSAKVCVLRAQCKSRLFCNLLLPAQSRRSKPFGRSLRSMLWGACLRICKRRCISWENWGWYLDKKTYDSLLECAGLATLWCVFRGLWRKICHFFVRVSLKCLRYLIQSVTQSFGDFSEGRSSKCSILNENGYRPT